MNKFITTATLTCTLFIRSWTCPAPANMEGIAFTAGEELNLSAITAIGRENVNFFIDGEEEKICIRYMSHYDPHAMVFIGNYGMSYQEDTRMNCMGIILPAPDTAEPYAAINIAEFNFSAAVIAELRWLVDNDVITLSNEKINRIDSSLGVANNGGNQFWTHTNKVLAYNSWYTYDTTVNRWRTEDDIGVDGVRSANAIQGVWGCAPINPGVGIPPASLDATPVSRAHLTNSLSTIVSARFRLTHFNHNGLMVPLSQKPASAKQITIFNCRGAAVYHSTVRSGSSGLIVNGLPRGIYFGSWK